MISVTDDNYREVIAANKGALMFFSSSSCVPCKKMKEVLKDFNGDMIYISLEEAMEAFTDYGVRSVPAFVRGSEKVVGIQTLERLQALGLQE